MQQLLETGNTTNHETDELTRLRDRVRNLEKIFGQTGADYITITMHIPGQRSRALALLLAAPNAVTGQMMEDGLGVPKAHTRQLVAHLRRDLARYTREHDIAPLLIKSARSQGWWIDRPTKERFKAILTPVEHTAHGA